MDSAAVDCVAPAQWFPKIKLEPSERSRAGRGYKAANGSSLPNSGQKKVLFKTSAGAQKGVTWQMTRVTRPLLSVGKLRQNGYAIHFDENPRMVNKRTSEITPLREINGLFVLDMFFNRSVVGDFPRQG